MTQRRKDLMQRWQQQIQAGNECFNSHQLFAAIAHYQSAKQLAWELFAVWDESAEAVATVIISYHNLADLYLRRQQPDMAATELQRVHECLMAELDKTSVAGLSAGQESGLSGSASMHSALLSGLRRTYQAWLEFCQSHRPDEAEQLRMISKHQLLA